MGLMLDKRVERWGMRLWRRGEGWFGERCKEEAERVGYWSRGWMGRVLRGLKRNNMEWERWEVEIDREGRLGWEVIWASSKKLAKTGVSDGSEMGGRMGIGGGLWENGAELDSWSLMGGWSMTVTEGEIGEVEEVLGRVLRDYKGGKRKLVVGTDSLDVVRRLNKGSGICGEREGEVRRLRLRLLERGWSIKLVWVLGHVGARENEVADGWAKEGVWEEEVERWGEVLCWGKEKRRRKEREFRCWKEYWVGKERWGKEYFGGGGKGELGHGGLRKESRFLMWMRSGHGGMRGTRYGRNKGKCECGGIEDRDHVLLYCEQWEEERVVMRKELEDCWGLGEWVDMERLLFSEEGTRAVLQFGRRTG